MTAEFNLNLLERINRELDGDIPIDAFRHEARWNDILSRIEMHLVATRDVDFSIAGQSFHFGEGASIHTENSHKYGPRGGRLLLLAGGWTPIAEWTDAGRRLRRDPRRSRAPDRLHRDCPAPAAPLSAAMLIALVDIADLLLSILIWIIIIQVILSWLLAFNVLNTSSHGVRDLRVAIDRITAPLYRPIRRLLPDFGGIDFSPLVILILIQVHQEAARRRRRPNIIYGG